MEKHEFVWEKNSVVARGLWGTNARTGWQEREEALFFLAFCSLFRFPYLSSSIQNHVTQMVEGISNQLADFMELEQPGQKLNAPSFSLTPDTFPVLQALLDECIALIQSHVSTYLLSVLHPFLLVSLFVCLSLLLSLSLSLYLSHSLSFSLTVFIFLYLISWYLVFLCCIVSLQGVPCLRCSLSTAAVTSIGLCQTADISHSQDHSTKFATSSSG